MKMVEKGVVMCGLLKRTFTLHHLSDKTKVIEEMKRVLKTNGIFIINEMFCDYQNEAQMSHVYVHHIGADIDRITN